jgi:hypothetical protein
MTDKISNPDASKVDHSRIEGILSELRDNLNKPDAIKAIIERDRPTVEAMARANRRMNLIGMPLYHRVTSRLAENPVYDAGRAVRDITLTGVACVALFNAGKYVWSFLRGGI